MHYFTIFLYLLLIIFSVEARKLTTSNGTVFKLDLIHRDSPNSPYYNSSMTPKERLKRFPLGYVSRGHNIHLSSTYYNTSGNNVDIIPVPNFGAYLLKLAVGTPKVEFFVTADTGSNLIWVQCFPCDSCISNSSPPFDPTKSSTFQPIPCNTPACKKPTTLYSGCPSSSTTKSSSPCEYQVYYGDDSSSSGILAMETISLSSSDATNLLSFPSTIFGCGMNQTAIEEDGIIGLGMGPSSLISQIGSAAGINYKFSYCLPPFFSKANGKLALGADVAGSGVVSTPFFIGTDSTYYHLILNGIRVWDDDIQLSSGLDIIIDSGTTLTFLPASIYASVKTALESAITLSTTPSPDRTFDLCYNVAGGQIKLPDVVFSFEGADVMLRANNIFDEIEDGVSCLAMVASEDLSIYGNIAQINFEIGYDLKAKQVSFAPANCANH